MTRELLKQALDKGFMTLNSKSGSYAVEIKFKNLSDAQSLHSTLCNLPDEMKEELAKPEPEFTGWYCPHCETGVDPSEVTNHEHHQACGTYIGNTEPPKIKTRPVGKVIESGGTLATISTSEFGGANIDVGTNIYTSPPQQKPLSDDEINREHDLNGRDQSNVGNESFRDGVRFAEKTIGIGNQ